MNSRSVKGFAAKILGARGGKARWKKIGKKQRSKIMKEVRNANKNEQQGNVKHINS